MLQKSRATDGIFISPQHACKSLHKMLCRVESKWIFVMTPQYIILIYIVQMIFSNMPFASFQKSFFFFFLILNNLFLSYTNTNGDLSTEQHPLFTFENKFKLPFICPNFECLKHLLVSSHLALAHNSTLW